MRLKSILLAAAMTWLLLSTRERVALSGSAAG